MPLAGCACAVAGKNIHRPTTESIVNANLSLIFFQTSRMAGRAHGTSSANLQVRKADPVPALKWQCHSTSNQPLNLDHLTGQERGPYLLLRRK